MYDECREMRYKLIFLFFSYKMKQLRESGAQRNLVATHFRAASASNRVTHGVSGKSYDPCKNPVKCIDAKQQRLHRAKLIEVPGQFLRPAPVVKRGTRVDQKFDF